jgi:2-succinyl-6-hydroxy-2,4-cyclohexadiene-1-carboxylate synthase
VSETVVLLHGFAGTARHWDRVTALLDRERYSPLALDLAPATLADAIEQITAAVSGRFILCGYSMGGRLALHVAACAPARVSRLVLVSTTAGSDEPAERLAADEELAVAIERGTTEDFIGRWRATPLFAEDPDWVKEELANDTRRLSPGMIAALLRAFSAGRLPSLWDRLQTLEMPAVVLAGERDIRYSAIARRLAGSLAQAQLVIVPGAGHRLALEAPDAVARAIAQG